jgi:transposase-like protein
MAHEPKTLTEAILYFSDMNNCIDYLALRRWPSGAVACPTCGRKDVSYVPSRRLWQCKTRHSKAQFSIKTGTILEDSPLGLEKWLPVMWMVANCKNGVSSWEIHRALGVTQKTAWFMLHRIRLGMQSKDGGKLGGSSHSEVEIDETYIGGKARNMHRSKRERLSRDGGMQGGHGKTVVMGMLERDGEVRTEVLGHKREKKTMRKIINENVFPGTWIMTDEFANYDGLSESYTHNVVNHLERYVNGNVHTNGIENFWSLLKRGLSGTYVAVEPFHLFRYVDEQAFRFNNRSTRNNPMNDGDRFSALCSQIVGKRLTYAELTAKEDKKPEVPF